MSDQQTKDCYRCGRPLKSKKSQDAGFGPVCFRKHEAELAAAGLEVNTKTVNVPGRGEDPATGEGW